MNKNFLLIIFVVAAKFICAQTNPITNHSDLKATKGAFVTELNFNPFKGNLSLNNSLNQIKGRYFVQDGLALRLGLGLDIIDSTSNYGKPYGKDSYFNNNEVKATGVGINFGIEKHFKGTNRLSPYIGLDLSWGTRSTQHNISTSSYGMDIKNGWMQTIYYPGSNGGGYTSTQLVSNAYNRFGAYAVAGFDFYLAKSFLIGYEFNLGYLKTKYKTPEVTVTGQQSNNYEQYTQTTSSTTFKTSLINGIRVGYAF